MITTKVLTGEALEANLDAVAALRIEVFRAFPYLYEGDLAYERDYVATYRDSKGAVLVGAFDGDRLVGAATGTPLADHAEDFAAAFKDCPIPLERIFYCAESVLLPAYRGQGLGHRFFDLREDHARSLGATHSAFASVIRPDDHPLKPKGYRKLDDFWRGRGYAPLEGAIAKFTWRDIADKAQSTKPLQIWMREL